MKKKFRAYYKPDLDTPDGALKFEQVERDYELWFEYDEDIRYEFYIPFMDEDWVVQQWTGLTDKNGKEIYEGDILFGRNDSYYQVKWGKTGWWMYHERGELLDMYFYQMPNDGDTYSNFEIIGNIFENPELLSKNEPTC